MLMEQDYDEAVEETSDLLETIGDLAELYALADMRAAIAATLFESPEHLDSRYLWTTGRFSYFRINRWSGPEVGTGHIRHSTFVRVEALRDGWRIRDVTGTRGNLAGSHNREDLDSAPPDPRDEMGLFADGTEDCDGARPARGGSQCDDGVSGCPYIP